MPDKWTNFPNDTKADAASAVVHRGSERQRRHWGRPPRPGWAAAPRGSPLPLAGTLTPPTSHIITLLPFANGY